MLSTFSSCLNTVGGGNCEKRAEKRVWSPEQKSEIVHKHLDDHTVQRFLLHKQWKMDL